MMRTTIDLPEDLLELAKNLSRGKRQTLSQAVVDLIRRGIEPRPQPIITISPITGLAMMSTGGPPITREDVRALEDEE